MTPENSCIKPAKICSTDDFYQVFSFLNRNDLDHLLIASSRFKFLVQYLFPSGPYRLFDRVRINFHHGLYTIAFNDHRCCQGTASFSKGLSRNRSLRFDNFDNILPYLASKSNRVLERVVLCLSSDCQSSVEKVKDQINAITHLWKNSTLELDLGGDEEFGWNIVANPEMFRCNYLILHDDLPLQILHSKCTLEKTPMLEIARTFPTNPQNVQYLVKLLHTSMGKFAKDNKGGWAVKIHPSCPVDRPWETTTLYALIEELKRRYNDDNQPHPYKIILDFPVKNPRHQEQMIFTLAKCGLSKVPEELSLYFDKASDLYILERSEKNLFCD
ncbi:hypothetical protein Ddc_14278 [Ditylenchus destructor]|nr:hypothetical protein Ddc_14278 [Ditylenchus destructor]